MTYLKRILIGLLLSSGLLFYGAMIPFSQAEITLDGTMGPGGPLAGPDYIISDDFGRLKGANLFHSFGEFNVLTGESATFTGPDLIENVIGRVTGGNLSFIDGLLSCTILDANLFLLNPYGVMFGQNATLDVNGSFHVSTGDYLRLTDGGTFYADPAETSVLTVAPPAAFGFLGENPANISIDGSFLQVPKGETLSIVGGDIGISDGTLYAPDGQISLVSTASSGEVALDASGPGVDSFENLGTINISHSSTEHIEIDGTEIGNIDVSGTKGGTVFIRGGQFTLDGGCIWGYISGDTDSDGGIDIRVRKDATLINEAEILADTFGSGNAGGIFFEAKSLTLTEGAFISSDTHGAGNGGYIGLEAENLTLTEEAKISSSVRGNSSGQGGNVEVNVTESVSISESEILCVTSGDGGGGFVSITTPDLIIDNGWIMTDTFGAGNAGGISLEAENLSLTNGAFISGNTGGAGNAGYIGLETENLNLTGESYISSSAWGDTTGQGGDLTINATGSVSISGKSTIFCETNGDGDGGFVSITTPSMIIDGGSINSAASGAGNAGHIHLDIGNLALTNRANISSNTSGTGDAGYIGLDVNKLTLTGGAMITSSALENSAGQGGNVTVNATESVSISESSITCETKGDKDGGFVSITTPSLQINNGWIMTDTYGAGNGGYIDLNAENLTLTGDAYISGNTHGAGDAGGIDIDARNLTLTGGATITSSAIEESAGKGGNVEVNATESVSISESGITCLTSGDGGGGSVSITTPSLLIDNGWIMTDTYGAGNGGYISLEAENLTLTNEAYISGNTHGAGNAGHIELDAESLLLTGEAEISSSALGGGSGRGGSVTIDATESVSISEGGITCMTNSDGDGGFVSITTPSLLIDNGWILTDTTGAGNGGDVLLNAGNLTLTNEAYISGNTHGAGDAGYINLEAKNLTLTVGAEVSSSALGESTGNGGNVMVNVTESVFISGRDQYGNPSGIFSDAEGSGSGGNIELQARQVRLADGAVISAESSGAGNAGGIFINASDTFQSRDSFVTTEAEEADGGNILISANYMVYLIDSKITASVGGGSETTGGNITITPPEYVILKGSSIIANAFEGRGGNIRIKAETFLADPESSVSASSALGIDGTVDISAPIINISGFLAPLPKSFLGAADLLRNPCEARIKGGEFSSFVISGRDGLPIQPDGLLPSPIYRKKNDEAKDEHIL